MHNQYGPVADFFSTFIMYLMVGLLFTLGMSILLDSSGGDVAAKTIQDEDVLYTFGFAHYDEDGPIYNYSCQCEIAEEEEE